MKAQLFIVSNIQTLFTAAEIIESNNTNIENHLLIVSNACENKYLDYIKISAQDLNLFSKIFLFRNYVTSNNEFQFNNFKNDAAINSYSKIYATCFYIQCKIFIKYFSDAEVYLMANGTASYQPQSLIYDYDNIKGLYSLNYFDKIVPYLCSNMNIKNLPLNKSYFINKYSKLSNKIQINLKPKSVIFCANNLFLYNKFSVHQEYFEYKRIIKMLIDDNYIVYFKNHPRTSDIYLNELKHEFKDKIITLGNLEVFPIEAILCKLKPEKFVSCLSTANFNAKELFNIPTFSFLFNLPIENCSLLLAYAMVLSYFNVIESNVENDKFLKLSQSPLYQILLYKLSNLPIKKEDIIVIQEYLRKGYNKELFSLFNIDECFLHNFNQQVKIL